MALLIDTDVLIGLERGAAPSDLEQRLGEEERAISVITMSELLHGVLRATGAVRSRRRAFVEHLLAGLEAMPITETVARSHAAIWAELSGRGELVGAHDLWIAATALAHGYGVATGNAAHFERVPGLRVVDAAVVITADPDDISELATPVPGTRVITRRHEAIGQE